MLRAGREATVTGEVVEKVFEVAVERVDRLSPGCNEAVDGHRAVQTLPQLPSVASNIDVSDNGTNGIDIGHSSDPVYTQLYQQTNTR
jgi:uncharacterized membrane protein